MEELIVTAFTTLLVVIDPVGVAPIFMGLTLRADARNRRLMALRGVLLAAAILVVFAFIGHRLLTVLGVGLPAFRIAGGALLFLLAVDMLLARPSGLRSTTGEEDEEARHVEDISVFPLAIPLLAGPGAMTSIVLLMGRTGEDPWRVAALLGVLAGVLALTLVALLFAGVLARVLGRTGANVISRVLGIVLAALAVQFMLDGLAGAGMIPGGA
ncbi:MAG: MarC family protein [bacterium]